LYLTSLCNAAVAVWRSAGSIARRVSISGRDDAGKFLNVSSMHLLYDCRGLKMVACGSFDFFQYSSEGEPQSLNILCSCSTYEAQWIHINKIRAQTSQHEQQTLAPFTSKVKSLMFLKGSTREIIE